MAFLRRVCGMLISPVRMFSTEPNTEFIRLCGKSVHRHNICTIMNEYNHIWVDSNPSMEVWEDTRNAILKEGNITPTFVDSLIMDMCRINKNADGAISYFRYLKQNNYDINVAVLTKYFMILSYKSDALSESEKLDIKNTYDTLKQRYPNFDSNMYKSCIKALCLTDHWEDAWEIVQSPKLLTTFSATSYNHIAAAAFSHGRSDIGWKCLEEIVKSRSPIHSKTHVSYLEYSRRDPKTFNSNVERMFDFWKENFVIPTRKSLEIYVDSCNEMGWSANITNVSKSGICSHCVKKLSQLMLSKSEFKELSDAMIQKVLIHADIYERTCPEELERFKNFVSTTKPYDIVIDGLNIVHRKTVDPLSKTIDYFRKQGKVILILGRKHMMRKKIQSHVDTKTFLFLFSNMTCDDIYLLYATLSSGENAYFISMDMMRQHSHKLDDNRLYNLFKQWQLTHQYLVKENPQQGLVYIEPPKIMLKVHKQENYWHIPCQEHNHVGFTDFFNTWGCFRI